MSDIRAPNNTKQLGSHDALAKSARPTRGCQNQVTKNVIVIDDVADDELDQTTFAQDNYESILQTGTLTSGSTMGQAL